MKEVCPSPFCTYLPTHLSLWLSYCFQGGSKKKAHVLRKCQKFKSGTSPLRPLGGHSPGDNSSRPLMWLLPPLNALPVWHIPHSTPPLARLVPGDQLVPGDRPAFTRAGPDQWSRDRPRVCLVRDQRQSQSVSRGPEVSGVVVEDPGKMGQERGATGTLPHRLGSAAPRCPPCYSGE